MDKDSIYQFTVEKLNGEQVSLASYSNKVILIVNIASQCGFTPQLQELTDLKKEFGDKDLEILAFPSNDFGGQEPLEGDAIATFCSNYGSNITIFEKARVRGQYAIPLYKFLADKNENGRINSKPRWNFHKYLIDRNGHLADFFYPFTKPTSAKIRKRIQRLLTAEPEK
ncbi:glutathione peroxidase [Mucilaginibacter phyllosphaerae]|uniref:Glutathione peroxidase n=1 Tax=Mucilaginibacter phyllosphaerae TaxID=1812349 RepID=A0A4Y8AKY9_9SPHI|nr:glutathione peroxidase [Mucilaginibacter phyllosphaerae]MBB3967820.1 glutathione peroxidase [Mucilaginibacter phyllosphaerae]TEW69135.1 glutathione peroxidase [Mucilaginibacter phyllosphaerae]GGH03070.1 glutathione peroxidase [Mucilaginibacter phyllosphaerae]